MKLSQLSLATRNALVYFILFIFGLGVSGYLLFSYSSKEILSLTVENLEHSGDLVDLRFESYMDEIETDLNQLAYSPLLERYISNSNADNLNLLTQEYLALLKSKSNYFQVRLISAKSGDELIRVERNDKRIFSADFTDLQNKEDRDYFSEIKKLSSDSVYFSKIDLNREYDAISQPITPTLRMAKLLNTDSLGGVMLIINVQLKSLFLELKDLMVGGYEIRIVNQDGHYLIHPNHEQEFTFDYGLDPYFEKEYDEPLAQLIDSAAIHNSSDAINKFVHLKFKRANYKLAAIISAKENTVYSSFYSWRRKIVLIYVIIALIFVFIAFIYLRRQVRELKTITNELMLFTSDQIPQKLEIKRNDEIGELARGFELMSNRVSESHKLIDKARKEAEKAFEQKNEFLENMSHEIRNPLQSIIGTIQILEQNQISSHQIPYVNALKFSANQLKSLVTDVLDYSKIKRNQIELQPEWINLDEFCSDLIKALNYQAISKGIQLKYDAFEGIKTQLYHVDHTRLYQILNNLIMNALKFTKNGGDVKLRIREVNGQELNFQISDNGGGISSENMERIATRSYTSDYVTGAGLGLTIVQKLLELFNSTIHVESELGIGSIFSFNLNLLSQASNQFIEENRSSLWDENTIIPKVLIIEDDAVLCDWYAYIFQHVDLTIHKNPKDIDDNQRFDLIISDLNFGIEKRIASEFEEGLCKYLLPSGQLVFVTGEAPIDAPKMAKIYTKPVEKIDFENINYDLFCRLNYGNPSFDNFLKDYDGEVELVKNVFTVLMKEWSRDQLLISQAIANRDQRNFDQIKHKIITSIRRLELMKFEEYLNETGDNLQGYDSEKLTLAEQKVNMLFTYYIKCIKAYF